MFFDPFSTPIKDLLKAIRQGKLEDVRKIVKQHGRGILTQEFEGKLPLNWALINYQLSKFSIRYPDIAQVTDEIIQYLISLKAPLMINESVNPLLDACLIRDSVLRNKIIVQIETMLVQEAAAAFRQSVITGKMYRPYYTELHLRAARGEWPLPENQAATVEIEEPNDLFGLSFMHYFVVSYVGPQNEFVRKIDSELSRNPSLPQTIVGGLYKGIDFNWWVAFFVPHQVVPKNPLHGALETAPTNLDNPNCGISLSWLVSHEGKVGEHSGSILVRQAKNLYSQIERCSEPQRRFELLKAAPKNRFHEHFGVTTMGILAAFSNHCTFMWDAPGAKLVEGFTPAQRYELVTSLTGYHSENRPKTTAYLLLEYSAEHTLIAGGKNHVQNGFLKLIFGFSPDEIFVILNQLSFCEFGSCSGAHLLYLADPAAFNQCITVLSVEQRAQLMFADKILESIVKDRNILLLVDCLEGIPFDTFAKNVRRKGLKENNMRTIFLEVSIYNKFKQSCSKLQHYLQTTFSISSNELKQVLEGIFENYMFFENKVLQAASKRLVTLFKQVNSSPAKTKIVGYLEEYSPEYRSFTAQADQDPLLQYIALLETRATLNNQKFCDIACQAAQSNAPLKRSATDDVSDSEHAKVSRADSSESSSESKNAEMSGNQSDGSDSPPPEQDTLSIPRIGRGT